MENQQKQQFSADDSPAEKHQKEKEKLHEKIMEMEAELNETQDRMLFLAEKERVTNDEYQDARKKMIQFWNANEDLVSGEKIRVKWMGQLNPEPFLLAVRRKHRGSEERAEIEAMELCSIWEGQIGDVQWHPFKVDVSDGIAKTVVDKNDGKLLKLTDDYGEEVYNEVVRAKMEIEEHNPNGRYVILELWNFENNRKATLEEATDVMLKIWKNVVAMEN